MDSARTCARAPKMFLVRAPMSKLHAVKILTRARHCARFCEFFHVPTPPKEKLRNFEISNWFNFGHNKPKMTKT